MALVTGATGYIGGRLVPALLSAGFDVRVLARHPERLRDRTWSRKVQVTAGDATDVTAMDRAMNGVAVAYFLLHSLSTDPAFEAEEQQVAAVFAAAAAGAGVSRIVYLGGLIPPGATLSPHLRSREQVGRVLRASGVPTVELRAAVILGSGSVSFEMLRYLTERLPAMTTPRWVNTRIQPIAVRDVLRYLVAAADLPSQVTRSFDIGGPDVLTYAQMMQRYAAVAGLRRRLIVPVPVLSPGLSSHWVGLITPVPASIARPLVESLKYEMICREHDIAAYVPDPADGLLGFDDAVRLALARVKDANVATRWSQASTPGAPADPWPGDPAWSGGTLFIDAREVTVNASPAAVWTVIDGIGGEHGWYSLPVAWWARGVLEITGGVGRRRGRRNPEQLAVGDAVDFWRVEERIPERLLRLRAELRMPGLGWLEFALTPAGEQHTVLSQRALFHPRGLAGHAYWQAMKPFHRVIFNAMIGNIADAATRLGSTSHLAPDIDQ